MKMIRHEENVAKPKFVKSVLTSDIQNAWNWSNVVYKLTLLRRQTIVHDLFITWS